MAKAVCGEGKVISVFSATSITSGATATSDTTDLTPYGYFGVWYQASPASAASGVRVYFEQSYDDTSANFSVPEGVADIANTVNGTQPRSESIAPIPMPYIRFRGTCSSAAASDLKLTLFLFVQ